MSNETDKPGPCPFCGSTYLYRRRGQKIYACGTAACANDVTIGMLCDVISNLKHINADLLTVVDQCNKAAWWSKNEQPNADILRQRLSAILATTRAAIAKATK